jgi:leucyl aminopeptidase
MKLTLDSDFGNQEVLVLGIFEEDKGNYKEFDKELSKELTEAERKKIFTKKFGEKFSTKLTAKSYKRVVVLGLGKKKEMNITKLRKIIGKAVKCVRCKGLGSFTTNLPYLVSQLKFDEELLGRATAEGFLLANYSFDKYLSQEKKEKKMPLKEVCLQYGTGEGFSKGLKIGSLIAESTNFVRDLVNEPAGVANSTFIEKAAKKVAGSSDKISIKVLDKGELEKLGMNALLGVNAGSDNPPKLLILKYSGGKGKPLAIVGKGITFDSGGYNIKPTRYIEDMKTDMAGAAAVLGTIMGAAKLGLEKNLIGVMPLCENLINGSAQKPGDIVKAYNGKTIEIGNTDAEGRLILADALAYVEDKYKPEIIIDLATLTGACIIALGYYAAGMVSKDEALANDLVTAGGDSGDYVWQLPFYDDYQDWMDGTISDLNNIALKGKGYEAGSIMAGVFLSKFVEKAKWAHIDIAGSAYWMVDGDYLSKGATGSGVRVLLYYLLN